MDQQTNDKKRLPYLESILNVLKTCWDIVRKYFTRIRPESDPDYLAAKNAKVEVKRGVDYNWVAEFAKDHWNRLDAIFKHIDEKADGLIKLFGGGTGLLALSTFFAINKNTVNIYLGAIPAFVLAILTVALAIWARAPLRIFIPPSVAAAKRCADEAREHAQGAFLKLWHQTCEYLRLCNEEKSRRLKLATICCWLTLASLIIPLIVAIYHGPEIEQFRR
ncbi:MAG: hypothetical protein L0Y72_31030 [Gemmataceae bacterium]|nr:hypothetical protein [Gemmataceae bacterium]